MPDANMPDAPPNFPVEQNTSSMAWSALEDVFSWDWDGGYDFNVSYTVWGPRRPMSNTSTRHLSSTTS